MHFIIILHFAPPPVALSPIYHNRHYDFEMARFYIPALAKGYVIFDEAINIRLYPSFYTPFYPIEIWIWQNYVVTLQSNNNQLKTKTIMNGLIILFCLAILAFNVYLLFLQIRMSNDIHAMRYLFTTLFKEEVKKKVTEENIRKTKEAQKPVITAPDINTPDPSKSSRSKNDVDEFLDEIHSYKKENEVVDKKWLNDLINKYNANFNEDFSQYLSLSKDITLP